LSGVTIRGRAWTGWSRIIGHLLVARVRARQRPFDGREVGATPNRGMIRTTRGEAWESHEVLASAGTLRERLARHYA
jgi:hypothetical protein